MIFSGDLRNQKSYRAYFGCEQSKISQGHLLFATEKGRRQRAAENAAATGQSGGRMNNEGQKNNLRYTTFDSEHTAYNILRQKGKVVRNESLHLLRQSDSRGQTCMSRLRGGARENLGADEKQPPVRSGQNSGIPSVFRNSKCRTNTKQNRWIKKTPRVLITRGSFYFQFLLG